MDQKKINVQVKRFSPGDKETRLDSFEVPLDEKMSVFNVLDYIGKNLDPSLAFYGSCRMGRCLGCTLRINGKRGLACITIAEGDLQLEPDDRYPLIRDLVVDMGDD